VSFNFDAIIFPQYEYYGFKLKNVGSQLCLVGAAQPEGLFLYQDACDSTVAKVVKYNVWKLLQVPKVKYIFLYLSHDHRIFLDNRTVDI